jgi:hypothetical protein
MEARWLKRTNADGSEESFYPITHVDAIVTEDGKKLFDQEVLAAAINSLIEQGAIEVGGFRSPIKIESDYLSNSSGTSTPAVMSGSGQGELYIMSNSNGTSLIVDGVSLGALRGDSDGGFIKIEFRESFEVSVVAGSGNSAYVNAVFY